MGFCQQRIGRIKQKHSKATQPEHAVNRKIKLTLELRPVDLILIQQEVVLLFHPSLTPINPKTVLTPYKPIVIF